MKILIHASENTILEDIARHMQADLGEPMLLYEIESANLAAIAVALGGSIIKPVSPAEPAKETHPIGVLTPEKVEGRASGKFCLVCDKPIVGRGGRAVTCSDECAKERVRRYQKKDRARRAGVGEIPNAPLA